MPGALTTVTICWTPVEAGLLRDALETEGIRSFVRESHLGTIDPFVTPALGGIRLDVDTEHLDRARGIVEAVRASLPAPAKDGAGADEEDRCPACAESLDEESDACPACGWTLPGSADGTAWAPSTTGAFRLPRFRASAPGTFGVSAGWGVLSLYALAYTLAQAAQSYARPAEGPSPNGYLGALDIPLVALGFPLLLAAGFLAAKRGMPKRLRHPTPFAGRLAMGMAAGILLDEVTRIMGTSTAVGWFLLPFLGSALMVAWPAIGGAGLRRTAAALGLVRGKGVLREAAIGLLAFPAVYAAETLCLWILRPAAPPPHPIFDWLLADDGWFRFWGIAAVLVQIPLTEELVFRGAIYRFLRNSSGVAVSVILSSFLFAICHMQGWGAIPPLMIFGAGAALLREWRGSLVAPMAMHAAAWAWILVGLALPPA